MFEFKRKKNDEEKPKGLPHVNTGTVGRRVFQEVRAIVLGILTAILIASIAYYYYWSNHLGSQPITPDTTVLSTTIPTNMPIVVQDLWSKESFLSSDEVRNLRSKENVINLAVFESNGNVRYSKEHSIEFNNTGVFSRSTHNPTGFESISMKGTQVELHINNGIYQINAFQPFAINKGTNPELYIVDDNGQLWVATLDMKYLVSLEQAKKALPYQISPNQNLSFSY